MLSSVLRFLGKTRSFLDIDLHRSPPISENGYVPVAIDLNWTDTQNPQDRYQQLITPVL